MEKKGANFDDNVWEDRSANLHGHLSVKVRIYTNLRILVRKTARYSLQKPQSSR